MKETCPICNCEINYNDQQQIINRDDKYYRYVLPYETRYQKVALAHRDCSLTLDRMPKENIIFKLKPTAP